jgi:hypothetical protein
MNVNFTEKDFSQLRKFQNKMNVVFGESAYVGTDYSTVLLEYSPALKLMVRPQVQNPQYNFEVKFLYCDGCKKSALYLALPEENNYLCDECVSRKLAKKAKQSSQSSQSVEVVSPVVH